MEYEIIQRKRTERKSGLSAALRKMKPDSDDCIIYEGRNPTGIYTTAKRLGLKVTIRKQFVAGMTTSRGIEHKKFVYYVWVISNGKK